MTTPTGKNRPVDDQAVHRLCYVEEQWAWFTSRPVEDQWGDDWNDRPYEHNAGTPYEWMPYMAERGIETYTLVKVAFDGGYETPSTWTINSAYSVEDINRGKVAWLSTERFRSDVQPADLFAGATVEGFIDFIESTGGTVYLSRNGSEGRKKS